MSSKKISTTIAFAPDIYALMDKRRRVEQRSFSFIVDEALRQLFNVPSVSREREGEVHAD